jgi:hypothetical protein
MKRSAAKILREYGPFPGADRVNGVTYDGKHVWFASGDKLNAFDPESGKTVRSIDVAAHAGTAFDGKHLFQIAEDRIQKIDPKTGRVLSTIPAPGGGGDSGLAWAEGTLWVGQHRGRKIHRVQPRRHRGHLDRRRALARHLGRRRERFAANRFCDGRGPGEARDAARSRRVGARIRWRRSVLLRRRKQRESENRPPAKACGQTGVTIIDRYCIVETTSPVNVLRYAILPYSYSQRFNARRSAAPAVAASRVSGMTTVRSVGRSLKYSGLSRLYGLMEIFSSDLCARHQSIFL